MRRIAALVIALYGCPSNNAGGVQQPRSVSVGSFAAGVDAGTLTSAGGTAPAPQSCPPGAPTFCDAGCCAASQACGDAGNCATSVIGASCPPEAPVVCGTAADCSGGCVAIDSSGSRRNFFLTPPARFVQGRYGTGVSIRGATVCPLDFITNDARLSDPLTVEMWVRVDAGTASPAVFYNQGHDRLIEEYPGGEALYADFGGGTYALAGAIADGAWHFIAATAQGTTGVLFIDGVQRGTSTVTAHPGDAGVTLGGTCNTFATNPVPFTGEIDEMRILSYAADGGQIADDFDAGHLTAIGGTIGLWHFDEGDVPQCCPPGSTCGANGCDATPLACARCGGFNGTASFYCPAGDICAGSCGGFCAQPGNGGVCPDATYTPCDSICCPTGSTCVPGSVTCNLGGCTCHQPSCTGGTSVPKACSPACPAGYTCNLGYCTPNAATACNCDPALVCGNSCCVAGTACVNGTCVAAAASTTCPPDAPVQCGPDGPCCPSGTTCSGGACVAPIASAHTGPQGAPCATGYCDTGLSCGGGALCCPTSAPQACGSTCCPADETCSNGQCGCPTGETTCGTRCCPSGSVCNNGACEPVCASGSFCGGFCCAPGVACKNGACGCTDDHPVQCGDACCLPGASCLGAGNCACPSGRASCGDNCCAAGDVCNGGVCGPPSSGSGGFDGTYVGSCTVTGQLGSGTSPANIRFVNGVAVSGLAGGVTATIDATGRMTIKFLDSCGVSFPVTGTINGGSVTLTGGNTNDLSCAAQDDRCTLQKQ
ncbi:MAG: LamG-like jellyroll fold domain-containing protein [Myxococcales bacterium]